MKLKLENSIKSIGELEICRQEILLFSEYGKSMYLIVDTTGMQLLVKNCQKLKYFSIGNKYEAQKYYDSLNKILTDITNDFSKFKDFIEKMEVDINYEIDFREYSRICVYKIYKGNGYSWSIYSRCAYVRNRFPLKSSNLIKSFKTASGAKKSLINEIKSFF